MCLRPGLVFYVVSEIEVSQRRTSETDGAHQMDRDELLREALADVVTQNVRVELCKGLAAALSDWGEKLFHLGTNVAGGAAKAGDSSVGDVLNRTLGLSCIVQIAGELGAAGTDSLEREQCYAAWALLRQLVECEYLCWAFSENHDDARLWLRSSRAERLKLWQPHRMRERSEGTFRAKDYHVHCEMGGHPTPRAFTLLPSRRFQPRERHSSLDWLDFASHLSSIWDYTIAATPELFMPFMDRKTGPFGPRLEISLAVEEWRHIDPLLLLISRFPDFPDLQ